MKTNIKKIVAFALVFSVFFAFSPRPAQAVGIWGESFYRAMFLKQTLEDISKKMQETIVATLKMNAIRTIQGRMMSLLGGGGGGQPQIVQNWRETIYGSANKEANLVVKDYFSSAKSGTGVGGQKIVSAGQKMYSTDPTSIRPTIDQYVREGRVEKIFDKNYTPNPVQALVDLSKMRNYPAFYTMTAQELYAINYGEKAGSEAAKNIAYGGYKGTGDTSGKAGGGEEKITMPGSALRDTFTKVMNMPTDMISFAKSVPEIVAAMVTQMLTQMINKGFSMMNQQIDRQINTIRSQTGGSIQQVQGLIRAGKR
jgi:hypothetical protein